MKKLKKEELEEVELILESMHKHAEDVTIDNITLTEYEELEMIYNIIVGEFINETGGEYEDIVLPDFDNLSADELNTIKNTLNNAAVGLYTLAKQTSADCNKDI